MRVGLEKTGCEADVGVVYNEMPGGSFHRMLFLLLWPTSVYISPGSLTFILFIFITCILALIFLKIGISSF